MFLRSVPLRLWLGGMASSPGLGLDVRPSTGQYVNVLPEGVMPRQVKQQAENNNNLDLGNLKALTEFAKPEIRQLLGNTQKKKRSSRWYKTLNSDIYDELLKLPLRYTMHPFDVLHRHMNSGHPSVANTENPDLPPGIYEMKVTEDKTLHEKGTEEVSAPSSYYYAVAGKVSTVGYAPPLGPADDLDVIPFFVHRDSNGRLPGKIYSMNNKNLMPNFFMRITNVEGNLFRFEEELMKIFPTKKIFVRAHSVYVYNVGLDGREVLHHWLYGLGF